MGTFSVWHWLVLLLVVAVFVVPIVSASRHKALSRGAYAKRCVPVFLIAALSGAVPGDVEPALSLLILLWFMVAGVLVVLWSVHRARDAGLNRAWCLLLAVPLIGLIFWLVLLLKPARTGATRRADAAFGA